MQVSVETITGLERKMSVSVPSTRVDTAVENKLKEASRTVRLSGFRPGKVPMRVMRQRFGAGVRQEVLGDIISKSFEEAVISEGLRPAGQPTIEARKTDVGKDIEYTATFEIFPNIEVAEVSDFKVERPIADVADGDIDDIIAVFRKQHGKLVDTEKAAVEGDTLKIDFQGFKEGEAFEGGTAEGAVLELGSGTMIPGFENGLVGCVVGDDRTLDLTFPEEYKDESLAGAAVTFNVQIKEVKEIELAPIDQGLFSQYGLENGTEAEFREEVRQNMERELRQAVEAHVKNQVLDAIVAAHESVELPSALIGQEINSMRRQMFQQYGGDGSKDLDLDALLPEEIFREQAERRVRIGLVVGEMINAFKLSAEPAKIRSLIEDIASTYQDPEEVINWYYSENEQLAGIESRVLEDAVVETILGGASLVEVKCSYQDALARARPASRA